METTTQTQYKTVKKLHLPTIDQEILQFWKEHQIFEESLRQRADSEAFVFFEGPPSVNGMPGIHHIMSRTIKDLYCRYKNLKGFRVHRKAGWDTHGLPIELSVEKRMGIKKEDIGTKISVEEYNQRCREEAVKYKDIWDDITEKMGYWVDMDKPYVTFENNYIETLWQLLKRLYDKGLLYKGYTIQPYSPAAGTGLSSHELNQPGCYRDVKDTTATAQFKISRNDTSEKLWAKTSREAVFFLAWTTTPWTLPSNTALAVGKNITYVQVDTWNPYTHLPVSLILAKELLGSYFKAEHADLALDSYEPKGKTLPYQIVAEYTGAELTNMRYEQLLPYAQPTDGDAFKVITGDFVTTESGTGIVHIAPSFGADDLRVARQNGIGSLTLVNKRGRFVEAVTDFADRPVKNYDNLPAKEYRPVDVDIVIKLKQENKAFTVKKYEHSYPHCWRTDKPIIYYPLDSWFVKTTDYKERMVELNKTINWKPKSTGEGRFGNWLENLVDWNLSRSRFWGTPLPIWRTEDGSEEICIGSVQELAKAVEQSIAAGFMDNNPFAIWLTKSTPTKEEQGKADLHKPYIDRVVLVSPSGKKMHREPDLIDVWFDSGSMPYAQWHYPFENEETFKQNYPADFIAEGVDQTRGWFFTLHAIATMLFDSVAFKNVVSNGLVLDAKGVKMSKRLGNTVDPFETISTHGVDATRWYIISNSAPWDNLRFDVKGVKEVQRKFLGTLFNTYSFFALYANIDGFTYQEEEIPVNERPEIDRWIISLLNTLIKETDEHYANYDATRAARLIQDFTTDHLSNWYVRLCRRRFWKGAYNQNKISAYQTLYRCLEVITQLMSPIAPFVSDFIFQNLNNISQQQNAKSIHLSDFPTVEESVIDKALEERMEMAQRVSSMVLALRKKVEIKVRQPLQKILIPISNESQKVQLEQVKDLILSEINVKELEYVSDTSGMVKKKIKPDFKKLGRKLGKQMKFANQAIQQFTQADIAQLEKTGSHDLVLNDQTINITVDEVIITSEDIEGWLVNSDGNLTVALDVTVTDDLKNEGLARELVKALQNLRKDKGFEVTDRIVLQIEQQEGIQTAIEQFTDYICTETLAESLTLVASVGESTDVVNINELPVQLKMDKA